MEVRTLQLSTTPKVSLFPDGWKVIVPEQWLRSVCQLKPKTLAVAMALWYLVGKKRQRDVVFSNEIAKRFGVNRKAKVAGLVDLEAAGLVGIQKRGVGRSPLVIVLDVQAENLNSNTGDFPAEQ